MVMVFRPRFLLEVNNLVRQLNGDVSLKALARRAGQSPFQFHRQFKRMAGITLKQYTLRLRLERAAGELLATDRTIAAIAAANGFASHEVFTRAFYRHYKCSPKRYRMQTRCSQSKLTRMRQRKLVNEVGPCINFFGFSLNPTPTLGRPPMTLISIIRKEIEPMPFLFIHRQTPRAELQGTLADSFGKVYTHCMQAGLEMAGFPLARYLKVGPGLMEVEAGVPLVKPTEAVEGIQYCELPGGSIVFAVHGGLYDELGDTHAAIERWVQEQGLRVAGPHWEWYVTDPAEHPDPADWRTNIYYPIE